MGWFRKDERIRELEEANQALRIEMAQIKEAYNRERTSGDLAISLANEEKLRAENAQLSIKLSGARQHISTLENILGPRDPLKEFVGLMEKRLQENDHKGEDGWRRCDPNPLYSHLLDEVRELHVAMTEGKGVRREAADVANMAMMIADNATS